MPLPWRHFRPASSTLHLEESSITGTLEISGSAAMRLRNFTIVGSPSMRASSTLMSMTLAPLSTCWRAMARQASQSPAFSALANFGEPVILVRSPMMRKLEADFFTAGQGRGSRQVAKARRKVVVYLAAWRLGGIKISALFSWRRLFADRGKRGQHEQDVRVMGVHAAANEAEGFVQADRRGIVVVDVKRVGRNRV
jgi:hypothetical protein